MTKLAGLPRVGAAAPDFILPNQFGEQVSLTGLRGSGVVVVFFPFAFSRVCRGELAALQGERAQFEDADVRLLAISCDSRYTLRAWAEQEGFEFDLLSDFWPHGATARSYGAFNDAQGLAERASFVIDGSGSVKALIRSAPGEERPLQQYRNALEAL
ncbi:redoxin domain-containing protein [Arthrobacter sp. zg-Y20]|uniref:redoxin domain-containing protein n=1 Tax=unclassified Arthrobacter TaxID=235627 RepID=UPI001D139CA9|nr:MULTISPECIES: redoxin domain-containing protein [unclassified Arthrobacter]MCC3275054.1 redoxin domain-containing protein [Arthrobacter sp. zg-Y20]MDK1315211.1 redoxin domain-containing protein [Arthrobacter sp. zg.Y20]WIB05048.1 redoxin domain-containing protein [Arthrobacter sp. zg-Y20]